MKTSFKFAFMLAILFLSCTPSKPDPHANDPYVTDLEEAERNAPPPRYDKMDALTWSQIFVKDYLKSPGSAKFPVSVESTEQLNDTAFQVLSYVDSQNGFGALLRTYYKCKVLFKADGSAICRDMKLEQQ